MDVLSLEKVSHAYGNDPVIRDLSLTVEPGELACLLGPSGCGKTTLLRLAAGLETLQRGRIRIGGTVVADGAAARHVPPERRATGLMFQDYALFPHLTVRENILFGVSHRRRDRQAWADEALVRVGLSGAAGLYPHVLSGGQQQRAALLRALAPEPRVLLLDEPFSGLDVTLRVQVREETLRLLKETGVTILMVTHDPEEAMFMADRILVMKLGEILQSGTPAEAYFKPINAFVAELFGPINRLRGVVAGGAVATPVGRFPAPGIAEGSGAEVMVRPEAITFAGPPADGPPTEVWVEEARLLGRSTHLRLRTAPGGDVAPAFLQARIPGVHMLDKNTAVKIRINLAQSFVFPLA